MKQIRMRLYKGEKLLEDKQHNDKPGPEAVSIVMDLMQLFTRAVKESCTQFIIDFSEV